MFFFGYYKLTANGAQSTIPSNYTNKEQFKMIISIGGLQVGQKVTLAPGTGYPAVKEETEDVILEVHGNSALTVGGIALAQCNNDGLGITLLPEIVPDPQPSERAQAILDEVAARQSELE